jgi:hypothetical protein
LYKPLFQQPSEGELVLAKTMSIDEQLAAFAWLQAIGTNIAALGQTKSLSKSKRQQEEAEKLSIIGNAMQSIANAAQAELTVKLRNTAANKESNDLTVVGNLLQSLGNALQVIAGIDDRTTQSNISKPSKTKR